jgi:hypothetical protein
MSIVDPGARPGHDGAQPSPRPSFFHEQNHRVARLGHLISSAREQTAPPKGDPGCVSKRYAGDAATDGVQGAVRAAKLGMSC